VRVEDAGSRTWLLAAVAAWGLLAWLLAVGGMGGRIEPLPDDPSLLQPLPPVRPAPPPRIGPLGEYEAIAARPLFSSDRKPHPFSLQDGEEQAGAEVFDYVLTSVLITPRLKLAIIQTPDGSESVRVRLDQAPESHPAWRLVGLSERSAVFEGPEGQRTLELRVFDGVGGIRPTELNHDRPAERPATPARRAPPAARDDGAVDSEPPPDEEEPPAEPATDQARMDAIRERIQARRAKLRGEAPPPRDAADPPPPPPANRP
jgi:general secretion pathway protein N